jgi:chorismate-pyruvate lyase
VAALVLAQSPEQAIAADPSLGLLQKILLTTDGTVTQLLELFTGQEIRVRKLEHALQRGGPPALAVSVNEPVLSRKILLSGPVRGCMYAHSLLVPARLPRGMQEAMGQTDTPMGQLWRAAKLETYREILEYGRVRDSEVEALLGVEGSLLSRSYLIHVNGLPMGLIRETFPADSFTPALSMSGSSTADVYNGAA